MSDTVSDNNSKVDEITKKKEDAIGLVDIIISDEHTKTAKKELINQFSVDDMQSELILDMVKKRGELVADWNARKTNYRNASTLTTVLDYNKFVDNLLEEADNKMEELKESESNQYDRYFEEIQKSWELKNLAKEYVNNVIKESSGSKQESKIGDIKVTFSFNIPLDTADGVNIMRTKLDELTNKLVEKYNKEKILIVPVGNNDYFQDQQETLKYEIYITSDKTADEMQEELNSLLEDMDGADIEITSALKLVDPSGANITAIILGSIGGVVLIFVIIFLLKKYKVF